MQVRRLRRPRCVVLGTAVLLGAAAGCGLTRLPVTPAEPASPTQVTYAIAATSHPGASAQSEEFGRQTFARQCSACHGADGRGDGPAAYLLYPKPRDFKGGAYRFVSTWERVPTDDDLYLVISRGIPGSAMPSWAHLPESERWALVHYLRTLRHDGALVPESAPPPAAGQPGRGVVIPPPEPPFDAAARARAQQLFTPMCAYCHGAEGHGDGPLSETMRDDRGLAIRARDLHSGVFKRNPDPASLFRVIVLGIPGSPMPGNPALYGDDAWHLAHYVLSLSSDTMRERAEMKRYRIRAARVAKVPEHPDDSTWRQAEPADLHMMPLWWRYNRPEYLTVQAVHDGKELALLLLWADDTHDARVVRPQDFRDAAAVQFAADSDPPFFAMGEAGRRVNIWMWKSERQEDLDRAFGDVDRQYPQIGIDSYPNLARSPLEQPLRSALTLESDKTFVTGWGAGNIVSDPTLQSSVEDLTAEGIGTLAARPRADQIVHSKGSYALGSYRVVFHRALGGRGEGAISLHPGQHVQVAFAIWNGAEGDRDGKKSVTIWQDLELAE